MTHSRFVHLHLHTQYSLLDGAIRLDDLFSKAIEYKMPAVAMTDHGNIFGAVEFYQKATSSGIKPIIGCEVYVAPGKMTDKTPASRTNFEGAQHLVLLVKNIKGYHNLCKLLTKAYLEGFYYKPRVDKELLKEFSDGLIALSACLHGEIPGLILSGNIEKARGVAKNYSEIFPDRRFFLELQNNGMEEQQRVNSALIEMAKTLSIPLVATNDCHYLGKADAVAHDALICIQTGKKVADPDRLKFSTDEFYFKSPDEMKELFRDFPEAIENTVEIAERCNLEFKFNEHHLPEFSLPEGSTVDSLLEVKAKEGLEKRLSTMKMMGEDVESKKWQYYERLKKELNVIKKMGFSGYFLIVNDVIEYARSRNISVGPGRGSAAGSLAAYSLGVTNLDPIRYNLLFERFLNPDRISLPDIDIDFCFEGRDEVIRYAAEKYGSANVCQIITFGQMKTKAVIRDVGRVLDMPYVDVDRIAKLVPNEPEMTIARAIKEEPRLKKLYEDDRKVKELMTIAKSLEGLPRHASTHAAGVVIANKPLVEHLPLYKGQKENIVTTQFAMKDVEKIGLVKFDFLGIKTLTQIDKTIKLVRENKGVDIDIETISLMDKATYKLIAQGLTNGVFQLESSGMKELLRKLKPERFEDLIAAVALYRPGPLQSGMVDDFIKRKQGLTRIIYDEDKLKDILETTYGVMVYQEQVMEIAKVLAGFTPGEADVLRKAMGKKVPEVMLEQRSRFIEGAKEKNIAKNKAEKIFDLMAKFAGYGFNKSHSAAYAMIAYQTAYMKTNYPVEFMSALLTINMGDTDKVMKYIGECNAMGIKVLPPDMNESSTDFTVKGTDIRFGLAAIKNVGEAAVESIVSARGQGRFDSFEDLLKRVDSRRVNKKVIESLIKAGAMDFTGIKRCRLMAEINRAGEPAGLGQGSLFETPGAAKIDNAGVKETEKEWSEKELLAFEKEALGFYITSHPLNGYRKELKLYATDTTETIREKASGQEVKVGGVVAELKETMTKKGQRMAFARLEDLSGSVEVIIFSGLYKDSKDILGRDEPLLIVGRVEKETGRGTRRPPAEGGSGGHDAAEAEFMEPEECKIIAEKIMPLEGAKKDMEKKTHIMAPTDSLKDDTFSVLKEALRAYPGGSRVFLHLLYPDLREVVVGLPDDLKIEPTEEVFDKIREIIEGVELRLS